MEREGSLRHYRWHRRVGFVLLSAGLTLLILFALSAKWWFGYGTKAWLADLGDGTLYTQAITPNAWNRPLIGWCGGINVNRTASGSSESWMWTWWTWGVRNAIGDNGRAYTVWPLAPLMTLGGAAIFWPAHRTFRRFRKNQCIRCGYSRAGLTAQCICPECGQPAPNPRVP